MYPQALTFKSMRLMVYKNFKIGNLLTYIPNDKLKIDCPGQNNFRISILKSFNFISHFMST